MSEMLRLAAWNIRAGGGKRAALIGKALARMTPDIVVLSEFRSGVASQQVAQILAQAGLGAQLSVTDQVKPNVNTVMIAARGPLQRIGLRAKPEEPGRWLMAREGTRGVAIGAMHIPVQASERKLLYHDAVVSLARRWRGGPALLVGDTNSGRIGMDEERPVFNKRTDAWFDRLEAAGWQDGFRTLYPEKREYTWYSHRDNGFRLDQVFVNGALAGHLTDVRHIWPPHQEAPGRRDGLSDHAMLVADFKF